MKTLLLDAGNTSLKWSLLSLPASSTTSSSLTKQERVFYADKSPVECYETLLNQFKEKCDLVVMVSVLGDVFAEHAKQLAIKLSMKFQNIRSQKELAGVKNAYDEIHTLGADRFVGMIAAHHLNEFASIVIDIGTATTIDAIDRNGQHLGGLILPGAGLCADSLLKNTVQLSQFNTDEIFKPELFPNNTTQAISSASILGLAGAIDSICEKMETAINKNSKQKINRILCGGGVESVLPYMQGNYQHYENLLMLGLQEIVQSKN